MLSTRRSPRQRAVARRKAAVRSSGASRPTRKAEDSSSTLQFSSAPIVVTHAGVVDQGGLGEERAVARREPAVQARGDADRLGQVGLPLLAGSRRCCAATAASASFAVPGDAEHRVPGVGEQLLGQRRAHAARRAGDDEQLQAAWASALFVCWMPAIAHSRLPSAGLTRCQTSSNGLGDAVRLLRGSGRGSGR